LEWIGTRYQRGRRREGGGGGGESEKRRRQTWRTGRRRYARGASADFA